MNVDEAKQFLESKGSLQAAIDAFFNETGSADVIEVPVDPDTPTGGSSSSTMPIDENDPDYVRPPIAPKRDVLVLPEYDNFRSVKRHNTRQALCPLRNFAREAGESIKLKSDQIGVVLTLCTCRVARRDALWTGRIIISGTESQEEQA